MAIYKRGQADNGVYHFPKKFVTLYGTAAITAGDWVMLDLSDTTNGLGASVVAATNTANGEQLVLGIASETTTEAGNVTVQLAGKYEDANVGTLVAAGESLVVSNDTGAGTGRAVTYVASDVAPICGIALETEPGGGGTNTADVMIINQGWFD